MAKTVSIQLKTPSVQAMIDQVREQIALRAHQIATERGYEAGHPLDDWLAAERQLVWKPALRLEENKDALIAKFRLPEVQPQNVQVYIDPQSILILGEATSEEPVEGAQVHGDEFRYGQIYREVGLPAPIDPAQAKVRLSDGVLTVSLPKPKPEVERKQPKASARRRKVKPPKAKKEE